MEKGVFSPSLIPQINPIARKIGKTQIFSDFRVKTNESVSQLMILFWPFGRKDLLHNELCKTSSFVSL